MNEKYGNNSSLKFRFSRLLCLILAGAMLVINSGCSVGGDSSGTSSTKDKVSPSAPTLPTATAVSSTEINFSWGMADDNVGVAGYKVFRDGTEVADSAARIFRDSGLAKGIEYCYTALAYDAAGNESVQTDEVCATPDDYYAFTKHFVAENPPAKISILFHVENEYGDPVTALTNEDFQILEDDTALSPTEHFQSIYKHEDLPYSLLTVLMLDVSSSISDADLVRLKRAAKSMIVDPATGKSVLLDQQKIAIYTFDDDISAFFPFTDDAQQLVAAINSIEKKESITSTNLNGAIINGLGRWKDIFQSNIHFFEGFMVVITDGADMAGRNTIAEVLAARGSKQIYTIGLGKEIDESALAQIGNAGNYTLGNYSELRAQLQQVADNIKAKADSLYMLQYLSPKRAGDHTLTLLVPENTNPNDDVEIAQEFNADDFTNDIVPEILVSGSSQVAPGGNITLSASTLWTNKAPDYEWASSAPAILSVSTLDSPRAVVTGVAKGTATVTVTDFTDYGVADNPDATYEIEVKDIQVSGAPIVDVGDSTALTAATVNSIGTPDYTWTVADPTKVSLDTSTGDTVEVTGVGYGTTTLTVTDTIKGVSEDVTFFVSDFAITPSQNLDTVSNTTALTASHDSGANPAVFAWQVDDSGACSLSSTTGATVTLRADKNGICTVTATDTANDNQQRTMEFMINL